MGAEVSAAGRCDWPPPVEYAVAVDRYLAQACLSPASRRVYRISLTAWAWPLAGRQPPRGTARRGARPPVLPLALLDDPDAADRLGSGLAQRAERADVRTVNRELSALRSALGWWLELGWITHDPSAGLRHPSAGYAAGRAAADQAAGGQAIGGRVSDGRMGSGWAGGDRGAGGQAAGRRVSDGRRGSGWAGDDRGAGGQAAGRRVSDGRRGSGWAGGDRGAGGGAALAAGLVAGSGRPALADGRATGNGRTALAAGRTAGGGRAAMAALPALSDRQAAAVFGLPVGLREVALWRLLRDSGWTTEAVLALDADSIDLTGRRVRGAGAASCWRPETSKYLGWLLAGRTYGPVFLTDRRAPSGTARGDVCPVTGRARMSYRRAAELFTSCTRPLDPSGRGYTLHQLRRPISP